MFPADFQKAPFLRFLFPLIGGIILGRDSGDLPWLETVCCLACLICLLISFLRVRRIIPLLAVFFFAGIILGREPELKVYPEGWLKARICREFQSGNYGKRTCIDRISYLEDGRWIKLRGKAILQFEADKTLPELGQTILVRGRLNTFSPPPNPDQFDYGRYQRGKGILYRIFAERIMICREEAGRNGLRISSQRFRRKLIQRIDRDIEGSSERAILNALLMGYKDGLTPALRQNFARSGSMHILAVSGLHVGILYLLPALLLRRLRSGLLLRISGHTILFMILWGYAFLTGLSSSVVRAVGMCCIYGTASLTGRKLIPLHVLSLVAFIMIISRPHMVYEAGFQLSFTAVTGIVLVYPRFMVLFPFSSTILRRLAQLVSVSLAAQLSTTPLAIFYFNQFAPGSILANLLVIPLATLILYGGLMYFIISGSGIPVSFPASVLELLSSGLDQVTRVVAELPGAYFEGLTLTVSQVILIYLFAGLFILYIQHRDKYSMFALLAAIILLLAVSAGREVQIRMQSGIYVFSLPNQTAVGFIKGRQAGLFLPEGLDPGPPAQKDLPYSVKNFFIKRKIQPEIICSWEYNGPVKATNCGREALPFLRHWSIHSHAMEADIFLFMGTRILILRNWYGSCVAGLPSLETDILLLCNNIRINMAHITGNFNPERVLADNSNNASHCKDLQSACSKAGIPFSSIRSDGCIILE